MRQVLFDRCGEPGEVLYLADVDVPRPGPGEAVLRVLLAPLHPADLVIVEGTYVPPEAFPAAAGIEAVGVVESVGQGVDRALIGTRCAIARVRGAWAEHLLAPAASLIPVIEGLPDELACQIQINPLTAALLLQSVRRRGAVLNVAAGSAVGHLVAQFGAARGRCIIDLVRSETTAAALRAEGRRHVVDTSAPNWYAAVRAAAAGEPIVAAFDPVAGPFSQELLTLLDAGGELVLYGSLSGQPVEVSAMALAARDLAVRGFWLAPWMAQTPADEQVRVLTDIQHRLINKELTIPIAGVYRLDSLQDALREARRPGRRGKVLLRP
ncbi:MAG: zinc-binding dehydrogenase [Gammaproteobacteria bacterium]|nr:zinc-binding dehydrogenase [Gammaproteobacteria bacterium]